jgi:hypothetical protein
MLDGKIGQISGKIIQVVAAGHPAIIMTGAIKAGSGQWAPGTILARTAGELAPWNGSDGDPVGVATEAVDSTAQVTANYLAHGCAVIENLKLADGGAPSDSQIFSLAQAGIYGA